MCHHNTFLIYSSIQEATQNRWDVVTHWSIITSLIVALLFGIAGYTTFTAYSQGKRYLIFYYYNLVAYHTEILAIQREPCYIFTFKSFMSIVTFLGRDST